MPCCHSVTNDDTTSTQCPESTVVVLTWSHSSFSATDRCRLVGSSTDTTTTSTTTASGTTHHGGFSRSGRGSSCPPLFISGHDFWRLDVIVVVCCRLCAFAWWCGVGVGGSVGVLTCCRQAGCVARDTRPSIYLSYKY